MDVDERFSKLVKDPCYKKIARKERKVKIDSRFEKMFTDERFHAKFSTDKRGKAINVEEIEDLHNFYDLDDNKSENEADVTDEVEIPQKSNSSVLDGEKTKKKKAKRKGKLLASVTGRSTGLSNRTISFGKRKKKTEQKLSEEDDEDDAKIDSNDENVTKVSFDDIRGETLPDNDDSDDSDESNQFDEDDMDGEEIIHGWGDLDENVKYIENAETNRIAVCNCDWDKIGANDLYVLFDSFKPVDGMIKFVKIYPSEFGIERMKEEKLSGPKELRESAIDSDNESKENEEGSRFHMEKLREYQLNRLKYYYAVIECDRAETANKLYEELDGKEYELSATRLDLRFIPEDTTFDCEPKSVASGMSQLKDYEPVNYHNTALQQSTVRLTWDELDTRRVQATMRKFTKDDIESMDFKDYLASSSSEDEEEDVQDSEMKHVDCKGGQQTEDVVVDDDTESNDENKRIHIYKQLMQEIESKEEKNDSEKHDMEVSFKTNLGDDTDKVSSFNEISLKNSNEETECGFNSDAENEETSEEEEEEEEDNMEDKDEGEDDLRECEDTFFNNKSVQDKKSAKVKSKKKGKRHLNEPEEEITDSKKRKNNELELLLLDESEDKKHFNLKNILNQEKTKKSKRNRRKDKDLKVEADEFKIDVNDPRFSAVYSSHLYALDPSEPNFKSTKATVAIIEESQRRRKTNELNDTSDNISISNENKIDSRLSGLLQSVKSKTELHKWKKERKKLNC